MMGLRINKLSVLFLSLFIFLFTGVASEASEYVADEILVKFKVKAIPTNAVEDEALKVGVKAKLKKSFPFINVHNLKILDAMPVEKAIEKLKTNPNVEYVEPNYIYSINLIPNDPHFSNLWGLDNTGQTGGTEDADIDAPEAWDIQTGSEAVVVGVIDTGVDYTHEDLSENMWINTGEIPGNGIDDDKNGYVDDIYGINAITGSGNPMDDNGHGTHVSGTIGAVGNNGKGIVGVSHKVKIMALKFLSRTGRGYTSDAIECIQYVVAMKKKGIDIRGTNNSWGGGSYSQSLYDAIKALRDNDILFSAAAGNSSSDNDSKPFYPASYDLENIISVAATDHNDNLASFSNYGAISVDVAAPGANIFSTLPSNKYGYYSGTSMATPHVAGLAALINSEDPEFNYLNVKNFILDTVDSKPSLSGKVLTGGRINAYNALTSPPSPPPSAPFAPSGLSAKTVSSSKIDLKWTDNSSNETGFKIERKTDTTSFTEIVTVGANVTTYSDTGLSESTRYYYKVRAFNGAGDSDYSNEASDITLLNAPSNLTATTVSSSKIDLKWTDNSSNETGFKIERKTDTTSFTEIVTVGANVTTYSDTTLSKKTRYYYRVRAYNTSVDSTYSNEASARTRP